MNSEKIEFSPEELVHYNRQIILSGFGLESQKRLSAAKVLVIGAGGLGCPALLYLAAAGVGTIGIVDFDIVDPSNLHRQVLFGFQDIGYSKAESAKKKLENVNPNIHIITHPVHLHRKNAIEIIGGYDIVADGTDNFPSRYLINDACVLLNKPLIYASVFQFEGQVSVFNEMGKYGERGPNYRDLYPFPPAPGQVPGCSEAGVLGVLPGIIGSIQALEVIKVITGAGETLTGRLFTFDALKLETRTFQFQKRQDNPVNGKNPSILKLIDYEAFCGGWESEEKTIREISPQELYKWQLGAEPLQLIDVREPHEYQIVNLGGELIPQSIVTDQAGKIDRKIKVVVYCKTGNRSANVIRLLEEKMGFQNLYNLKGGIIAYIDAINPSLSKY